MNLLKSQGPQPAAKEITHLLGAALGYSQLRHLDKYSLVTKGCDYCKEMEQQRIQMVL